MARLLSALIVAQLTTTAVFAVLPSGVESLAPFQASSLTTAPDGAVYAAKGPVDGDSSCCWIVRIDGGTTVPIYRDDSSMFGLTATPDGALAFWTVGDGLKRLSNGSVKSISAPDFLALGGIAAASDGAIWYSGAFGGGLVRVGLAGDTSQYFASEFLISIVPGRNGSIWAPSRYDQKIVHVQSDGTFTTIVHNAACCGGVVAAADGNGGLWFTTPGDSTIYHLDAFDRPLQSLSTPGFNYYWSLFVARDGSLYIGGFDQILRFRSGVLSRIRFDPPPSPFNQCGGYSFTSFTDGSNGSVWALQTPPPGGGIPENPCPTPPEELYALLHISSDAFAAGAIPIPAMSTTALIAMVTALAISAAIALRR